MDLARVQGFQLIERRIESQHILTGRIDPRHLLMEGHPAGSMQPFGAVGLPRMIDQDEPHQLRGEIDVFDRGETQL